MTKNTTMKKVEIEIPEGKKAEWVNGVLTLVDDTPKDIKERVKTFEDACNTLGENHPFVRAYNGYAKNIPEENENDVDVLAFLKLRIICAALNEGWKPTLDKNECRYYPWFRIYTKEKYEELVMDEETLCRVPLRSSNFANAGGGLACASVDVAGSYLGASYGVRLAFKTKELAEYCGKQFIEEWADFLFA